ncbi:hypothetical protein K435DRAFT_840954 [Dendrothele bispora CBS 962.96]|uniref:Uncharacterized protein n=1 Tax=Dendrothele bispora (strain CBS 962.96) TaxID=1314807 RepID=A0A4S8LQC3_DENBC|nr:hypothetical protein K435DRAFT_840954 [Dendrothele bispora CBS 962.96]
MGRVRGKLIPLRWSPLSKEELAQAGLQGVKSGDGERSNGQKRTCNKARRGSVNSVMMENSMKKAQSSGSKVVDQQEVPTSECHRTTYDVAEVDQASTLAQGVATKGGSDVGSIGESRVEGESCEKK